MFYFMSWLVYYYIIFNCGVNILSVVWSQDRHLEGRQM